MFFSNLNAYASSIVAARTTPYATVEEVRRANTGLSISGADAGAFNANRFSITTYSDDTSGTFADLDAVGVARRVLSDLTVSDDIQNNSAVNSNAFARLSNWNAAAPWKTAYGTSGTFEDKYTANGLKQIIANIIAYQIDPTVTAPPDGNPGADPPPYLGLARTPYVNEVQVQYIDNGDGTVTRKVYVELFYPYSADGASYQSSAIVGSEDTLVVKTLPAVGTPAMFTVGFTTGPITITIPVGTTFNNATPYVPPPYQDTATLVLPTGPSPWTPLSISILAGTITVDYTRGVGNYRLDCAQVPVQALRLTIPWTPPVPWSPVGPPVWHGAEVNDPCVNENTASWASYINPALGTLGLPNLAYAPPETPPSKMHMRGLPMQSIGELGYIHTPNAWQYLTLRPNGGGGVIPDWLILDAFTVSASAVPNMTIQGRININSFINPEASPTAPITPRQVPLQALLNSVAASPATVALDIYNDSNPSVRSDTYGMRGSGATPQPIFDTIGELCEVPSLANGGSTEAAKEAIIRRIANLITVRSNTFTIWAIAQSIKEPPNATGQTIGTFQNGIDIITGEVKVQAIVERYEDASTSPPTVRFRTRYFRYWNQ